MASKIKGGKVSSIRKLKSSLKRRSGQYLTRIPQEGLVVRFLEEPTEWVEYVEHYDENRDPRYFPCVEEDCEGNHTSKENRPSKRFLVNAVDTEENKVIPLVLPVSAASSLMKKYDRYNTLLDRDYALLKDGTGYDTEYDVTPEAPSRMNLSKFEPLDLWAILEGQLEKDADEDDENLADDDEETRPNPRRKPSSSRSKAPVKKARPRPTSKTMSKSGGSKAISKSRPTKTRPTKRRPPY